MLQLSLRSIVLLAISLLVIVSRYVTSSEKPNILILFGDNLAYNDISIVGAPTAKTPNIDRLGYEGLKLNNWNSAAHLCSASRASLLTGKYAARMGVYPRVFRPDAVFGLSPKETTIANHLQQEGYATSIIGKWHLGHRPEYLPTRHQGFDEWMGIPYHMSGGSIDNHTCNSDVNNTMWLPLYEGETIIEQPVRVQDLADRYASASTSFIKRNAANNTPFFLYMAFSHVHQLCAPRDFPEQAQCQWSRNATGASFIDAVEEMDWIAGQILNTLDEQGLTNDTIVIFTSDNGPWVAEQSCAGSKGPFEGRWLQENVDQSCTACPHDYVPKPTPEQPRRCILPGTKLSLDGVHCGSDTGLGSVWEANLRMPALIRWPNHVAAGKETTRMVSTLDVLPTLLSIVGREIPDGIDGRDISDILTGNDEVLHRIDHDMERVLFFWRDGFASGPLPSPYGRFDVAAVKVGRFKAWIWTKSAHYNDDEEVYHDPPLLFDVLKDPAEAFPLDPSSHQDLINRILVFVEEHKKNVGWSYPYALETDSRFIPCVDESTGCRTSPPLKSKRQPEQWMLSDEKKFIKT